MMRVKDDGPGFTSRVPKMAIYGTLIDTAVTHIVLKCLRAIMDQLWHRTGIPRSLRSIISLIIVRTNGPPSPTHLTPSTPRTELTRRGYSSSRLYKN
jgi:hypothetical protein